MSSDGYVLTCKGCQCIRCKNNADPDCCVYRDDIVCPSRWNYNQSYRCPDFVEKEAAEYAAL